jgi:hypothetical protein
MQMLLLVQFLLRLSFGLAAAMVTVSSRQVTSGYFRNHLYVILGMTSLAALLSRKAAPDAFAWCVAAAIVSYIGSVLWLYERRLYGSIALALIAALSWRGAVNTIHVPSALSTSGAAPDWQWMYLRLANTITSAAVLGTTMAAMLLGHWYLNAPGMQLAPLRKLLTAMAVAVTAQAAVCALGLSLELGISQFTTQDWLFLILRWSFGLVGVMILIFLARGTLAVPNTQSATGILYVAVMGVFVGETMSLLLSAEQLFPV